MSFDLILPSRKMVAAPKMALTYTYQTVAFCFVFPALVLTQVMMAKAQTVHTFKQLMDVAPYQQFSMRSKRRNVHQGGKE